MRAIARFLDSVLLVLLVAAVPGLPARAATLAADVIIVVDTTGSMADEVNSLENSINGFAGLYAAAGIDLHLIVIGESSSAASGICVPAPLGSGNCTNDENLPRYRHVPELVGSTNALSKIIATHPQWQSSLRVGATRDFIVVTDDDSSLDAASFRNQLLALDPSFTGFRFNGIVASYPGGFSDPCRPVANVSGDTYVTLINQTGGVLINLCNANQNFGPGLASIVPQGPGPGNGNGNAPEPGALALFALGLVALGYLHRRRLGLVRPS